MEIAPAQYAASYSTQREDSMEEDVDASMSQEMFKSIHQIEKGKLPIDKPSGHFLYDDSVKAADLVRLKSDLNFQVVGNGDFRVEDTCVPYHNQELPAISQKRKKKVVEFSDNQQDFPSNLGVSIKTNSDGCNGKPALPYSKKVVLSPDEYEDQYYTDAARKSKYQDDCGWDGLKNQSIKTAYARFGDHNMLYHHANILNNKPHADICTDNADIGVILHKYNNEFFIDENNTITWREVKKLGQGGQGACWLAEDVVTGHSYCIKEVPVNDFNKNEVEITASLNHPNIVKVYGLTSKGNFVYILLEFIDGYSLSKLIEINPHGRLNCWESLTFFKQLLQILIFLQKQGILHEDMKGDNVIVTSEKKSIKLIDFGLAVKLEGNKTPKGKAAKGTPNYLSPEKAAEEGHNYASDLWACTGVLAHMLSGQHPWLSKKWDRVEMYIWNIGYYVREGKMTPPFEELPLDTPELVKHLMKDGWKVDPDDRASAMDMLASPALVFLDSCNENNFVQKLNEYCQMEWNDVDRKAASPDDVDMHAADRHNNIERPVDRQKDRKVDRFTGIESSHMQETMYQDSDNGMSFLDNLGTILKLK